MRLELKDSRNSLEFEEEHQLSKEPLRIDLLIIKKKEGIEISNEIGRFFRGHNLLEYKSPDDSLNIDTLYKAIGYACIYKASCRQG